MINKEYNANFSNINIADYKVNKALLESFIKALELHLQIKFNSTQLEEFNDVVLKTSVYNNHDEITYSDLWSMLESDFFIDGEMQNAFKDTLFTHMFASDLENIEKIKNAKFNNAKKTPEDKLSQSQKQNLLDAIALANQYMATLESNKNHVVNSTNVANKLTGEQMKHFYLEHLEHIQSMFRWHKLGCETVLG